MSILKDPSFSLSKHKATLQALETVASLQGKLRTALEKIKFQEVQASFRKVDWLRSQGECGGGWRYILEKETEVFHTASLNVSAVHYDQDPVKKLRTAIALSAIIHPAIESLPSIHMHISLTALKDDSYSMRLMADLNPADINDEDTKRFNAALENGVQQFPRNTSLLQEALRQGDRYFTIPALDRTRGVAHFYLEGYQGKSYQEDLSHARLFGETVIACYQGILEDRLKQLASTQAIKEIKDSAKLTYFTLYLFQVLSLDRGTISGLMVHNENDEGIMGSLPGVINLSLLLSWLPLVVADQQPLLKSIAEVLESYVVSEEADTKVVHVSKEARLELASIVRQHYRDNPAALEHLARGDKLPPTVENHR